MASSSELTITPINTTDKDRHSFVRPFPETPLREQKRSISEFQKSREFLEKQILPERLPYKKFQEVYLESPHTKELFAKLHGSEKAFEDNIDELFKALHENQETEGPELSLGLIVDFYMSYLFRLIEDRDVASFRETAELVERLKALEMMIGDQMLDTLINHGFITKKFGIEEETETLLLTGLYSVNRAIKDLNDNFYYRTIDDRGRELEYGIPTVEPDFVEELEKYRQLNELLLKIKSDIDNKIAYVMPDK